MYCSRCGERLDDDARYCASCGAGVDDGLPGEEKSIKQSPVAVVVFLAIAAVLAFAPFLFFGINQSGVREDAEHPDPNVERTDNHSTGPKIEEGGIGQDNTLYESKDDEYSEEGEDPFDFLDITDASTSSVLPTSSVNNKSYASDNLIDGYTTTVWCEGANGGGEGEFVTLSGPRKQTFRGFVIWSGYQESDYLYSINSRPRTIAVYADDDYVGSFSLEDAGLDSQTITFDQPVDASSIRIEILSTYEGSKYLDCCISEIQCF